MPCCMISGPPSNSVFGVVYVLSFHHLELNHMAKKPSADLSVIPSDDIGKATTLAIAKVNEFETVVKEVETFAGATIAKDGVDKITTALAVTVKSRTTIDKARKALIEPALDFQRKINETASKLQDRIAPVEKSLKKEIDDHNKAAELRAAEERLQGEQRANTRASLLAGYGTSFDHYRLRDMNQSEFDELAARAKSEFEERNRQDEADRRELQQLRELRDKLQQEKAAAIARENGVTMPGQTPLIVPATRIDNNDVARQFVDSSPPFDQRDLAATVLESERVSVAMATNSVPAQSHPNTTGSTRMPTTHTAFVGATLEQNVEAYIRGVQEFTQTFFRDDPESMLVGIINGRLKSFAMFVRNDVKNRQTF